MNYAFFDTNRTSVHHLDFIRTAYVYYGGFHFRRI